MYISDIRPVCYFVLRAFVSQMLDMLYSLRHISSVCVSTYKLQILDYKHFSSDTHHFFDNWECMHDPLTIELVLQGVLQIPN
jgi:hypothetical protein